MAATVEEIKNKITLYYNTNKMPKPSNSHKQRIFNWEPFSLRKTATTMDQIFYKIYHNMKGVHNKKYLQSFFPYYVFYDVILDLDGKIVFYIGKEKNAMNTGYINVYHIKKEFYTQYSTYIDAKYVAAGGNTVSDYKPIMSIHEDVDDIYFLFHKQYNFDSITQRREFKKELLDKISEKFFARKAVHLHSPGNPF